MTFSEKYEPLFDIELHPQVRYVIIVGGRGSGKSTAIAHWLHDISFNQQHVIINTRFTFGSAKDSVLAEFDKTTEARNSIAYFHSANNEMTNKYSGSKILFKGLKSGSHQQTARLKSITDLNIWVLDEAEELHDEAIFDDVDDSIRRLGFHNIVVFVLNSHHINKDHFIYRRFFSDMGVNWGMNGIKDNVMYIHTTFLDNYNNLSQSFKNKIIGLKENYPDKYRYNFLGEIRDRAEGVIFNDWEYGKFDESLPYGYGMDFGFFPDPDVLAKAAIDKKRKVIYCKQILQKNNAGVDDLAKDIKSSIDLSKSIIADCAEPRLITDLRSKGVTHIRPVKKGSGSVLAGIKQMQDYKIIVDPDSTEIGKELNNYVWSDKKNGVPVDAYNHWIDAIRYRVSTDLTPSQHKPSGTTTRKRR